MLSLDGGGLKGIFTAAFLAAWERTTGRPVVDNFDLIAGSSTGGIIALALGLGYRAQQIFELYRTNGEEIFPREVFPGVGAAKQAFGSRYSAKNLRRVLLTFFGNRHLGHSSKRLLIPAYHADRGEIYIFKTAHHPRLLNDYTETAVDVALGTAAAPTYVEPFFKEEGLRLIDGGMFANNPVLLAVTEAMGYLKRPQNTVAAVRLGTTWEPKGTKDYPADPGGLGTLKLFVDLMMRGQMQSASGAVFHLLGRDRFCDINPVVPNGAHRLDRLSDELVGLGESQYRFHSAELYERGFLDHRASPFQPFHQLEKY